MPAAPRGLPTIFLGETPKGERELPPVYLCETSHDGPGSRLKWMASTCLAGMVGVCLIGVAIYASMNMSDGSGMVSSIKRASLAALQPIRSARLAHDAQSPSGQKEDRIQMTTAGFVSRHVIHDTVVERQGSREFITIKPYLRIVAGMAMSPPENANDLPPFNPFKLYSDTTPIAAVTLRPTRRNPSSSTSSTCRAAFCPNPTMWSSSPTRCTVSLPRPPRTLLMPTPR
ncbi:hypothetical protein AUC69_10060 [Methyloceanibacter superfactus]|uniref:Uncharacterized protein n=1 Tax=Methyloceanibacter superfactus TaxID=1774969 RepID=A0A1E3VXI2_9HYPH|nr:hypothetical protein AUC69_10060 [Methyloceanibacter superfactus]